MLAGWSTVVGASGYVLGAHMPTGETCFSWDVGLATNIVIKPPGGFQLSYSVRSYIQTGPNVHPARLYSAPSAVVVIAAPLPTNVVQYVAYGTNFALMAVTTNAARFQSSSALTGQPWATIGVLPPNTSSMFITNRLLTGGRYFRIVSP